MRDVNVREQVAFRAGVLYGARRMREALINEAKEVASEFIPESLNVRAISSFVESLRVTPPSEEECFERAPAEIDELTSDAQGRSFCRVGPWLMLR